MSIEYDVKELTFNEFKKKYGYKYINIWIAENEVNDYYNEILISEDKKNDGIR